MEFRNPESGYPALSPGTFQQVKGLIQVQIQEPVSGFEPLTCRLQDGCSAN